MKAEKSETAVEGEVLVINGVEYVKAGSVKAPAAMVDGLPYVLVRTYSAGAFVGYLKRRDGKEVELVKARRLWYWKGANDLCDLANNGVNQPQDCKFSEETTVVLIEAIEIHETTKKAQDSISQVKIWHN